MLRKCNYLLGSTCIDDTAAGNNHRLLRLADYLRRLCHANLEISVRGARFLHRRIVSIKRSRIQQNIPGNIHQHRPRAAMPCQAKSLPDSSSQSLRVLDLVIVLCHRHGHIHDVDFLKGVPAQKPCIHLTCKGNHRNRIHKCRSQPCHQVGSPRAGGGNAHAYLAGSTGISVSSMSRILFVSSQNLIDIFCIIQCII